MQALVDDGLVLVTPGLDPTLNEPYLIESLEGRLIYQNYIIINFHPYF